MRPEECEWFTSAPERAGYQPPAGVKVTVVDEPTEALLLRGEIDALIPPNIVPSFRAKDPRIRRVCSRTRAPRSTTTFARPKSFRSPTRLVMRQALFDENPWLVASMLEAFNRRRRDLPQILRLRQALRVSERRADFGRRGRSFRQESVGPRPHAGESSRAGKIRPVRQRAGLHPLSRAAERAVCAGGELTFHGKKLPSTHERVHDIKARETTEIAIRSPQLAYSMIPAYRRHTGVVDLRPADPALFERRA